MWENTTNRTKTKMTQLLEHWVDYLTKIFKAGTKMLLPIRANSPETNGKLEKSQQRNR